jgi:hypothetical protein
MPLAYEFVMDVKPSELQNLLNERVTGWRVHSIWQRSPDARQPARPDEPLVLYDVLFERRI